MDINVFLKQIEMIYLLCDENELSHQTPIINHFIRSVTGSDMNEIVNTMKSTISRSKVGRILRECPNPTQKHSINPKKINLLTLDDIISETNKHQNEEKHLFSAPNYTVEYIQNAGIINIIKMRTPQDQEKILSLLLRNSINLRRITKYKVVNGGKKPKLDEIRETDLQSFRSYYRSNNPESIEIGTMNTGLSNLTIEANENKVDPVEEDVTFVEGKSNPAVIDLPRMGQISVNQECDILERTELTIEKRRYQIALSRIFQIGIDTRQWFQRDSFKNFCEIIFYVNQTRKIEFSVIRFEKERIRKYQTKNSIIMVKVTEDKRIIGAITIDKEHQKIMIFGESNEMEEIINLNAGPEVLQMKYQNTEEHDIYLSVLYTLVFNEQSSMPVESEKTKDKIVEKIILQLIEDRSEVTIKNFLFAHAKFSYHIDHKMSHDNR